MAKNAPGVAVAVSLAAIVLAPAAAGAGPLAGGAAAPAPGHPTVHGNLLAPVQRELTLAFRLAEAEVRDNPACSALFARYHADGARILAAVEFDAATIELLGEPCSRTGVAAFTTVSGRRIWLCPHFGDLKVPAAAMILIHEALHAAGLSERPADPRGLLPFAINRLVAASCSH